MPTHCSPSESKSELAGSFFVGPLSSVFFIAKLESEEVQSFIKIVCEM